MAQKLLKERINQSLSLLHNISYQNSVSFCYSGRLVPAASNPEEELENPSKKLRLSDSEALMGLSTLLGDSKVLKIGTVHPAEDYVALRKKKSADEVDREMERVMVSLLHDSLGTNATLMTKVGNCVRVYRQSAPAPEFNRWIRDFKQIVMDHHYETFWKKYIADEELGLVDVNPDEAHQFLLLLRPSAGIEKIEDDDDDLVKTNLLLRFETMITLACSDTFSQKPACVCDLLFVKEYITKEVHITTGEQVPDGRTSVILYEFIINNYFFFSSGRLDLKLELI